MWRVLTLAPLPIRLLVRFIGYLGFIPISVVPLFLVDSGNVEFGTFGWGSSFLFLGLGIASRLPFALIAARSGDKNGQTISKQMVGLRIVNADGTPLTTGQALLREFMWPSLYIFFGTITFSAAYLVFGIVEIVMAATDPEGRRVVDRVLNTRVVQAEPVPQWLQPGVPVVAGQYGQVVATPYVQPPVPGQQWGQGQPTQQPAPGQQWGQGQPTQQPAPGQQWGQAQPQAEPEPTQPWGRQAEEAATGGQGPSLTKRDVPEQAADQGPETAPTMFVPPAAQQQPTPADGWYADPSVPGQLRYWAAGAWTEHVHPAR